MESSDGHLISAKVLPYSHNLILMRDSGAQPVHKIDWGPDSPPIAATATSAAVTTSVDALRLAARFYHGPAGCLSHLALGSACVFKIRVPSGRLVIEKIIDGDNPLTFDVSWIGEGWLHVVVVEGEPSRDKPEDLPMWIHFLSQAEHAPLADRLPAVIATNYNEPGNRAQDLPPKRPFEPQTTLAKILMWGWKKMR